MESVKILHIADMHIGRKFRHLSSKKAMLRNTEVLLSFENVLERFDDAQIVLLSGDIFENDVSNSELEFVINVFKKHPNKKFFISFGNHDCIEYKSIKTFVSMLPKNVHAFSDTMEMVEVEEYNLDVYGASFSTPSLYSSLLYGFRAKETNRLQIMVLHADVNADSQYNPITCDEIMQSHLDYLALGHIHSFSGFHQKGNVTYAYPGVFEPGGFDEVGECGVIYGDVYKGGTKLDFYPVSQRQYRHVTVDVGAFSSNVEIASYISKITDKDNLYKITFEGVTDFGGIDYDLLRDTTDAFYVEFENKCLSCKNIFDYKNEDSLRGATACALEQLAHTCSDDVYNRACEILTKIMCRE